MGTSSGSPPPRGAGSGCSPRQEGHRGPSRRFVPCPATPSTGGKCLPRLPATSLQHPGACVGAAASRCGLWGTAATSQVAFTQPPPPPAPAPSHALETGQRSHRWEHKKKLRHFPGLCSSHGLDTGEPLGPCRERGALRQAPLSSALPREDEPRARQRPSIHPCSGMKRAGAQG